MTVAVATEFWGLSATELADVIQSRRASIQEEIEAHLRRIEAVNPSIDPRWAGKGYKRVD